jgi:hypothetical protein
MMQNMYYKRKLHLGEKRNQNVMEQQGNLKYDAEHVLSEEMTFGKKNESEI